MNWKEQIKHSYTKIEDLPYHTFSAKDLKKLHLIINRHPMRITPYYYSLINPNDKNDPIALTAIPNLRELERVGAYDTSGEASNTIIEGVQHKYATTVLLLSNNRCAMYCRHCFRKRMVGLSQKEVLHRVDKAIEYIKSDPRINNILVTGGDPLMLETHLIKELLDKLIEIDQLDFIRIGSRIPVTLPMRIYQDQDLLHLLKDYNSNKKRIYLVTHFNHPREISPQAIQALDALVDAGIIVSNQGVLLKGVNDDPIIMTNLLRKLVKNGVQPYYIFQCRPVRGIKKFFQLPLLEGIKLMDAVKKNLDGITKRFRFIMSTKIGKLEIIGLLDDLIILKHHQAKNPHNFNKIYKLKANNWGTWIDDFQFIR